MHHTTDTTIHLDTIRRELAKRETAYPKILEKKKKEWAIEAGQRGLEVMDAIAYIKEQSLEVITVQRLQYTLLHDASHIIAGTIVPHDDHTEAIYRELQRELRMRKACYPRWVHWHRMDAATADRETAEWQALTEYFHTTYCPEVPHRKPREKKTGAIPGKNVDIQLIGNKILSALDLDQLNTAEIKSRNYKYCTILNRHGDTFTAKVEYSETSKVWEPTQVMMDGNWTSIDFFESSEEGDSYVCEDYRAVL